MSNQEIKEKLIPEAKSIYECWNWDVLEAQMESGYDQGAFRELVNMYVKMVDTIDSQATLVDQQTEEIKQKAEIIDGLANERHDLINECDALKDTIFDINSSLNLAVKALEWYADESNHETLDGYGGRIKSNVDEDDGELAQSTLDQIGG